MTDKVALVTGAGSGIGRACALALARAGFRLALVGRKREPLEEVAGEIVTGGGEALVHPANVVEEAEVAAAFAAAVDRFGRLDLLFNNAGTASPKAPFEDVELRHWNRVLAVNVTGSFLCAREAFRVMKAQSPMGGRIINNGSVSAHAPRPWGAPYTASKHAITGLTKQLSLDGRAHDIACGQIDIGNAETGVALNLMQGMAQADGRVVPEPVMPLSSVAEAVVFMAGLPLASNVQFMTVIATKMPLVGRG
ncbi:SDR family NAD(P)-dependent oxidoreductase [Sphingomonas histidinilytica]|jgi:NAD(P)-dependent dehydrogenase (short-subunit alcohol dehydrogenase family)|uniref:NADP-dependent 3-hydroxy acid dehydrogenase YdfG n=1 Tax=Rhizorhabdus histidinilytica TaxID=439228 RepID=A0A1T5ER97_9SPHN|nr:SDR family oxidoreductase [Rhizorhabdus histidinilytica]MBO9376646.1 SDR family NAD(P)-dependent oxidoreductase [Rhizorhabdus histidinilytica]QEH76903.1 SDR family oxidoreductase [Sphingomonas sp. C8-2]SKB86436.1 NADP-dependent 3-hydroxy acid dehydrogenase YdfG [Rhizorhabdus histidinilytica]